MNLVRLLSVVVVAMMVDVEARSEVIRFKMTGTVEVFDPTFTLPPEVVTGAPFTALFTYDTSVPDSLPDDPQEGQYRLDGTGTEFGLALTIGSLTLRNDPTDEFLIEVLDNRPFLPGFSPPSDSLNLRTVRSLGGPPVFLPTIQTLWIDLNQDAWDSDALPTYVDPAMFSRFDVLAGGGDEEPPLGRPYSITAFVSQVELIPEPSSLALLAIIVTLLTARFRDSR